MAPSRAWMLQSTSAPVLGLVLPAAAPSASWVNVAPSCRHARAPIGIRVVSAHQDEPFLYASRCCATSHELKSMDMNDTVRQPLSYLLSIIVVGACAVINCFDPHSAYAEEGFTRESSANFQRSCAGCHAGGGNILQPSSTLFAKDLDRNGIASVDDIFGITYFGKGRMPGYGEKCTPRGQCTFGPRLSESDIRALAEFVRLQADQGWPK